MPIQRFAVGPMGNNLHVVFDEASVGRFGNEHA